MQQHRSKGSAGKSVGSRGRGVAIHPNWVPPQQPTGKGCAGKGAAPMFNHSSSIRVTSVDNAQSNRTGKGKVSVSLVDVLFHGMSFDLLRQRLEWWAAHLGYTVQVAEPVLEEPIRLTEPAY